MGRTEQRNKDNASRIKAAERERKKADKRHERETRRHLKAEGITPSGPPIGRTSEADLGLTPPPEAPAVPPVSSEGIEIPPGGVNPSRRRGRVNARKNNRGGKR